MPFSLLLFSTMPPMCFDWPVWPAFLTEPKTNTHAHVVVGLADYGGVAGGEDGAVERDGGWRLEVAPAEDAGGVGVAA